MFMVLSSWLRVIARVQPVHMMNAEQRQTAADLWTWAIGPPVGSTYNHIHRRHLLLLSPKADTHFTVPPRLEGWVELLKEGHN